MVGGFSIDANLLTQDLVLYGDLQFGNDVRTALRLALIEPTNDWLPSLPRHFRRRKVAIGRLAEARLLRGPAFVKPAREKSFPGRVYADGSEIDPQLTYAEDLPVLVAEPVNFNLEVRLFVSEREVTAWSIYARHGVSLRLQPKGPAGNSEVEAALSFARELLGDTTVPVPPAVTIDVGLIEGRGWAVVEANAVWASSLYWADPERVLPVLARASRSIDSVNSHDGLWIESGTSPSVSNSSSSDPPTGSTSHSCNMSAIAALRRSTSSLVRTGGCTSLVEHVTASTSIHCSKGTVPPQLSA
jgi:hypothetical protein